MIVADSRGLESSVRCEVITRTVRRRFHARMRGTMIPVHIRNFNNRAVLVADLVLALRSIILHPRSSILGRRISLRKLMHATMGRAAIRTALD
jgi:hypothetical protein